MDIKKAGPGNLSRSGTSVPAFSNSSAMIFPVDFREHLCYDGHNETAKMEEDESCIIHKRVCAISYIML